MRYGSNHHNHYNHKNHSSDNGLSRIITLELSKLDEIIQKSVEEMSSSERWAIYFKYLTDKSKRRKINNIEKSPKKKPE